MYKQNLHIHTTHCDGKDTPEAMLSAAIAQGFDSIGFSAHSYMHFAPQYTIAKDGTPAYIANINHLKEISPIPVFLGMELDLQSREDLTPYDYVIGSVHNLIVNGEYVTFDRNATIAHSLVNTYFGGDGLAFARAYYEALATLPERGKIDIIGHFDLLTKHSEQAPLVDWEDPAYQRLAIEAAEALAGKIPYFEVNTGAMARGYRTTPYPHPAIVRELKRLGYGAVITSDCHLKEHLSCGYDVARELLLSCGFTEQQVLTADGFVPMPL